jgi:limonene-1,2-epoxide hydrolase
MDPLTAARIQTVRDHMRLECEGDWDGVIATFAHPRYELYGAGTVFDGEQAVRGYFAASRIPFPDQANEIIAIGADGDSVLVEFWLTGTHLGPLRTVVTALGIGWRSEQRTSASLIQHMSCWRAVASSTQALQFA